MGLWWKNIDEIQAGVGTVILLGDPTAMPKSIPILWRFWQDWRCLEVMQSDRGSYQSLYNLHFAGGGVQMRYRAQLDARFIMVREGPDPVRFWARRVADDRLLVLRDTGLVVPANRFRPERSERDAPKFSLLYFEGDFVWV